MKGKSVPELPRLPGFLTVREASDVLGLTRTRVWQMSVEGVFGQVYRIGPHIVIQREGVKQEFNRRKQDKKLSRGMADTFGFEDKKVKYKSSGVFEETLEAYSD